METAPLQPPRPSLRRWFYRELPWLLGVLLGMWLLAWRAFSLVDFPIGSDWAQYVQGAEYIWHRGRHPYPYWRQPLYMYLMGLIGEDLGYAHAGRLISQLSGLLCVFAAGLCARALAGRWAGALAALIVPWLPIVAYGSLWVTPYALLAACTGLGFAFAACACRWPHPAFALLAGLAAGAAWGIDIRGFPVVLSVFPLVIFSWQWSVRPLRTLALTLLAGLSVVAMVQFDDWLKTRTHINDASFADMLRIQRTGTLAQIHEGFEWARPLQEVCADEEPRPMMPRDLFQECSRAILVNNYKLMRRANYLPERLTLLLIALTLVPARWSWKRSTLPCLLIFGVPAASVVVGGSWVSYAGRYLLQYAVSMAIIVPVGFFRVADVIGRGGLPRRALQISACLGVICWSWSIWPVSKTMARLRATPDIREGRDVSELARWARENVHQQDILIDCAGLNIDLFLAPLRLPGYVGFGPGAQECLAYVEFPPIAQGVRWLITRHVNEARRRASDEIVLEPSEVSLHGWELVREQDAAPFHKLWRYEGDE